MLPYTLTLTVADINTSGTSIQCNGVYITKVIIVELLLGLAIQFVKVAINSNHYDLNYCLSESHCYVTTNRKQTLALIKHCFSWHRFQNFRPFCTLHTYVRFFSKTFFNNKLGSPQNVSGGIEKVIYLSFRPFQLIKKGKVSGGGPCPSYATIYGTDNQVSQGSCTIY